LFFPWKTCKVRGLCAKWRLSSSLRQQAPACPAQDHRRPPPACHLLLPGDEVTPWRLPSMPRNSPLLLSSPWPLSPLSPVPPAGARAQAAASLAAPRLPLPLRLAGKIRHLLLFLPARRIEPEPLETPPTSLILLAGPESPPPPDVLRPSRPRRRALG
jgi:hypothetical protein